MTGNVRRVQESRLFVGVVGRAYQGTYLHDVKT